MGDPIPKYLCATTPPIGEKLEEVLDRIKSVSIASQNVRLIAVTKTKPLTMLLEAYAFGQKLFGENKVQEALAKSPSLPSDAELHLIGSLQSNKAKHCPGVFTTIHTLHKKDLAEKLNRNCEVSNKTLKVLIQMNLSSEASKSGLTTYKALLSLAEFVLQKSNLRLVGLMTIPDPTFSPAKTQKIYAELFEMNLKIAAQLGVKDQMLELSMGISKDFEMAIQEGATFVRVGSSIFGPRN